MSLIMIHIIVHIKYNVLFNFQSGGVLSWPRKKKQQRLFCFCVRGKYIFSVIEIATGGRLVYFFLILMRQVLRQIT